MGEFTEWDLRFVPTDRMIVKLEMKTGREGDLWLNVGSEPL
jgi:hypothetical protein